MATWRTIANGEIDLDSPVTQQLLSALRDNTVAVTEGASGAPRVQDAALHTTVTTAGRNWVANRMEVNTVAARTASVAAGAIGSDAMCIYLGGSASVTVGSTALGADLVYASADGRYSGSGPSGGTWRCLGFATAQQFSPGVPATPASRTTLWRRIN